tara:strand:- start:533 stop:643 length:111 start_codon:yes stop_codon:yes gene_type:complete
MVIHILGFAYGKNVNGKYFNQIMVSYIGGKKSEKKT